MGRKKNHLLQLFDLPSDITSDVPRVEWIKDGRLQIDNHLGLIYFTEQEIRVDVKDEILLIRGDNLTIQVINPYVLVINGKIETLQYTKTVGERVVSNRVAKHFKRKTGNRLYRK